ncbi:MAG: type II CAAX endopeptidase family protein [Burkholderiales bacterium]
MATPTEPTVPGHGLAAAAGIATLAAAGVGITLLILQVLGHRFGILDHVASARYRQATWLVLLALSAGIATFCLQADGRRKSHLFGHWRVSSRYYVSAVLAASAIFAVDMAVAVARDSSTPGTIDVFFQRAGTSIAGTMLAVYYFCGAVPVLEELLFRRGVFTLLRRFPVWLPITVSVALFALLHPAQAQGGAFLLGLATAYLYLRSGSLLPSIACHAFANGLAVAWAAREWQQ